MFVDLPFVKPKYGIEQKFKKQDIIITRSDNRLGTSAEILGPENIMLTGRSTVESLSRIRGDFARISMGKNCVIGEGSVIKPPITQLSPEESKEGSEESIGVKFLPIKIGDYVIIGKSSVVQACVIGPYVYIGDSCIIQPRCILESCCMLLPNTILAQGTVVPPYTVYGGIPGKYVGRLPPSFKSEMLEICWEFHRSTSKEEGKSTSGSKPSLGRASSTQTRRSSRSRPMVTRPRSFDRKSKPTSESLRVPSSVGSTRTRNPDDSRSSRSNGSR